MITALSPPECLTDEGSLTAPSVSPEPEPELSSVVSGKWLGNTSLSCSLLSGCQIQSLVSINRTLSPDIFIAGIQDHSCSIYLKIINVSNENNKFQLLSSGDSCNAWHVTPLDEKRETSIRRNGSITWEFITKLPWEVSTVYSREVHLSLESVWRCKHYEDWSNIRRRVSGECWCLEY